MTPLEHELELATRAILATEDWAPSYGETPDHHAKLIKQIASLERTVMTYFHEVAKNVDNLVNWWYYDAQNVKAYNVQVMVNNNQVSNADNQFLKIMFDPIAAIQATGAEAADLQYDEGISLPSTSQTIQDLTTEQVGSLIGKTMNDNGQLTILPVDNTRIDSFTGKPYSIDDTTRSLINNAIKKSLNLGFTQDEAKEEVGKYIENPSRAEMIARTEGVRAYNIGANAYATQAGYKGKYWTTAGATDFCNDNASDNTIPIDQTFSSGVQYAPAHQNCKCSTVYTVNASAGTSAQ